MQPGPPPESQPPGPPVSQPAAGWPPPSSHWSATPASAAASDTLVAPPPGTQARQGRPGLVALVAVLVEIIVIAAADNQWVAERVSKAVFDSPDSLAYDLGLSLLTYQWRFSPAASDRFHTLYGQWELIGVVLVLTAILVVLAARGRPTFPRVFLGTWAAVVAATGVGAIVRAALVDGQLLQGQSRFQFALYSALGPSQHAFAGGLALGFVTGAAAGLTAMAARRDERVAPVAPVGAPMPMPPPQESAPAQFERPSTDAEATRVFTPPRSDSDATEQFRPPPEAPPREIPPDEPEPTQALPAEERSRAEPEPAQARPAEAPPQADPEPAEERFQADPDATQALPAEERPRTDPPRTES